MFLFTCLLFIFFFNDTATTEIYTLSLHDALPISRGVRMTHGHEQRRAILAARGKQLAAEDEKTCRVVGAVLDRKSTRLNSSHSQNLVCRLLLEKKKKYIRIIST